MTAREGKRRMTVRADEGRVTAGEDKRGDCWRK